MPNVIPFGLGRHLTNLVVTPQAVNGATGALTDTTPVATLVSSTGASIPVVNNVNLSGDVDWVIRNNLEAIQGIARNRAHNVPTTIGGRFTLMELVRKGDDEAQLALIWFTASSRYCKISFAFGGAVQVVYARMRAIRIRPSRTRNVDTAEFVLIDANTAPTFVAGMR